MPLEHFSPLGNFAAHLPFLAPSGVFLPPEPAAGALETAATAAALALVSMVFCHDSTIAAVTLYVGALPG